MPSDFNDGIEKAAECIPTSWLDPLLTGPEKIGSLPFDGSKIERLLQQLASRIRALKRPTPDRSEARERIARIVRERIRATPKNPDDDRFGCINEDEIADAILATGLVQDEASIRAEEREKCAAYIEQRPGSVPDRQEIAAAIRNNGGSK